MAWQIGQFFKLNCEILLSIRPTILGFANVNLKTIRKLKKKNVNDSVQEYQTVLQVSIHFYYMTT